MISTSRQVTLDDLDRLDAAARRFLKNHGIQDFSGDRPDIAIDHAIKNAGDQGAAYLRKLWRAAFRRAVRGDGDTIAYGYVGWHVG